MNKSEVVAVIAAMNAVDPRVEPVVSKDDPRIGLFHEVLGAYPAAQAREAIVEYAAEPHMVAMQVGNVVEGIKRIRKRNLARIEDRHLILPDELPEHPEGGSQTHLWLQAAKWAVASGAPTAEAAMEFADERFGVKRAPRIEAGRRMELPKQAPGQARMDVVAGELLVTDAGEGEL